MIQFSVMIEPRGKERPRFAGEIVYTPKETVAAEREVLRAYRQKVGPNIPPDWRALKVIITATFPMVPSWSQKVKRHVLAHGLWHTSKPDKDNIEKLVYDALNEWAWVDDQQCHGGCFKRYGTAGRLDILITPMDDRTEPLTKQERDRQARAAALHDGLYPRAPERKEQRRKEKAHNVNSQKHPVRRKFNVRGASGR